MSQKLARVIFVPMLVALIALSSPALAAENATISGDKVRMRYYPSVSWVSYEVNFLNSGTRVKVLEKTDFSDTVEGYTEPWYRIREGNDTGYVFGRYVKVDAGVTVDTIKPGSDMYFANQVFRFVDAGLNSFGTKESEIVKELGRPISTKKYKGYGIMEPFSYYRLTYDGIIFEMDGHPGTGTVWGIVCTTGSYEFGGLRVGSPVADVKRLLGKPYPTGEVNIIRLPYSDEDAQTRPDRTLGDMLWYPAAIPNARFRIVSGQVTEIALFYDFPDTGVE
jgi:hypothetical protein